MRDREARGFDCFFSGLLVGWVFHVSRFSPGFAWHMCVLILSIFVFLAMRWLRRVCGENVRACVRRRRECALGTKRKSACVCVCFSGAKCLAISQKRFVCARARESACSRRSINYNCARTHTHRDRIVVELVTFGCAGITALWRRQKQLYSVQRSGVWESTHCVHVHTND